jgi:hypothetical protein
MVAVADPRLALTGSLMLRVPAAKVTVIVELAPAVPGDIRTAEVSAAATSGRAMCVGSPMRALIVVGSLTW